MCFIDSHCHLTDERFSPVEQTVNSAIKKGVTTLVDVGWSLSTTHKAMENAAKFNNVYFTAGIHPSEANGECFGNLKNLESYLTNKKCIAVGEIGLDYHYTPCDKARQAELFTYQIELANRFSLPIVIHSRDASCDMLNILTANKDKLGNGFLMHCYSESREQAFRYLDLGAYFAFGGVITFKNSKKEDIVKSIPMDRIMAETDGPYMSPEPFRGRINYPENVVLVYEKMASFFGLDKETLAKTIKENFLRFFKKVSQ